MRKELEIFENRSDDWLAKQRALEDEVSVWDFDDAKKLKKEHEIKHQAYERLVKNNFNKRNSNKPNVKVKGVPSGIIIFIIMVFVFEFLMMIMGF